jgi:hypothetical protein
MAVSNGNKTVAIIIVIIIIIIVLYLIYHFYWRQTAVHQKFNLSTLDQRLHNLERNIGLTPHGVTPFVQNQNFNKTCLDSNTQNKIYDAINQKLNEIDTCDCTETCKAMHGQPQSVQYLSPVSPPAPHIAHQASVPSRWPFN